MPNPKEILFVSHDANRAGAQIFLFNIMNYLQDHGYKIILLFVNDWGTYRAEFDSHFTTYSVTNPPKTALDRFLKTQISTLEIIKTRHNIDLIYVNTIASVHLLEPLKTTFGAPVVTHIHELSYSIKQFGVPNALDLLFKYSDKIVACSEAVAQNLATHSQKGIIEVIHSFVNNEEILQIHKISKPHNILFDFGLSEEYLWVGACGNADWRKAPDIFVQIASKVKSDKVRFAWIGIKEDDILKTQLEYDAQRLGIADKIHWISPTPKAVELINALDYFLLCSREDPFPLVMLEAALCQKPIFTFRNTGGGDEFVEDDAGLKADYLQVEDMAKLIDNLDANTAQKLGQNAQNKVLEKYSFEHSILKIENLIESLL